MAYTGYKIFGATCIIVGLVGTLLFLASTIISFVVINSDYYYIRDGDAVKFKMVDCCQITSLSECVISGRFNTRFCKTYVKYPTNLKEQINIVQNSNSQYFGLSTDALRNEKRSQINAPFYTNPKDDTTTYYSPDYPRDLWTDFNCRALVEYIANGTNSQLTSNFTTLNYPNFSQFNSSLSLSFTNKQITGYPNIFIQTIQIPPGYEVGSFMNCYTTEKQDSVHPSSFSQMYRHLSSWGGASIAFTVMFALAIMTGIIVFAVICSRRD